MSSIEMKRKSPVCLLATPDKKEIRDSWEVVLSYKNEDKKNNQYIVDLSHIPRWDIQGGMIDRQRSVIKIPKAPGESVFSKNVLINRMNRIQASIWHFAKKSPKYSKDLFLTQVTESNLAIALIGEKTFSIAEKLSALDFANPKKRSPFLLQGPFCHVPCQIVVFKNSKKPVERSYQDGLLITCSRGYGYAFVHAVMEAGEEFGLQPAGETRFLDWIKKQ